MAVLEEPGGAWQMGVGPISGAAISGAHVTGKPIPYGTLGHYRVARRFALINAQAAGAVLAALRNPSANPVVLLGMRLKLHQISAPTAAIEVRISAKIARAYSVAETANVVTPTLAGHNAKKRTSMATAGVVLQETNAAAGLTGGTKTLDSDAFMQLALWELAAVPTGAIVPSEVVEYEPAATGGAHPIVLATNEGVVITNDAVLGAAAAGVLYYEWVWAEVPAY